MSETKSIKKRPHVLEQHEVPESIQKLFEEADKENIDLKAADFLDYKSKTPNRQPKDKAPESRGFDISGIVSYLNEQAALVHRYEQCIDKLINVIDKQSTMIANYQNLVGVFLSNNESEDK